MNPLGFLGAKADVAVRVDKDTARPGDDLHVRVELTARKDCRVRRATVALVRVETYLERRTSGSYDNQKTHYEMRVDERIVAEDVIIEDEVFCETSSHSADVMLKVPEYCVMTLPGGVVPGSVDSYVVKFSKIKLGLIWQVRVVMDIHRARDITKTEEITVATPSGFDILRFDRSSRDSLHQPALSQGEQAEQAACSLAVSLPLGDVVQSDGTIEGILHAEAHRDISVSGVKVALSRFDYCITQRGRIVSDSSDVGNVVLDDSLMLQSGEKRDWPFRLNVGRVGALGPPVGYLASRWVVKGWLDIKRRFDPWVEVVIKHPESIVLPSQLVTTGLPPSLIPNQNPDPRDRKVPEAAPCCLSLHFKQISMRSYDVVEGIMRAEILKDFQASGIKLELQRVKRIGTDVDRRAIDEMILKDDMILQSGEVREWPFRLNIGQVTTPSIKNDSENCRYDYDQIDVPFDLKTEKATVVWKVRGNIDIPRRVDPFVVESLNVDY